MNILWILIEDMSPWLPAWGDTTISTPNIDRLIARGKAMVNCYSVAPVCSPSRSGTITSCYPTRLGLHHHVMARPGEPPVYLPDFARTLPELFQDAGYFAYNIGKDDYNFCYDREKLYHGAYETPGYYGHHHAGTVSFDIKEREWAYWRHRDKNQPFFGQIGLWGGKNTLQAPKPVDPAIVKVPTCYPRIRPFQEEVARHYECIQIVDQEVGTILDALAADHLLEDTAIFLFSDHGMGSLRHKQFCYGGGTHVPLILAAPNITERSHVDTRLISSIDIGATSLALAGIPVPLWMDGKDFLEPSYQRDYIVSARDRCDFTIDRIRSIRTKDFRYIRNFFTDRPLMQPQYRDHTACFLEYRRLYREGLLPPEQALYAGDARPAEELYCLVDDPDEVHNLADDPRYASVLQRLRSQLHAWITSTGDQGEVAEGAAQLRALIQRWGKARCVNPEYQLI